MTRRRVTIAALFCVVIGIVMELLSHAVIYASRSFLHEEIRTTRSIYEEQTERIQDLLQNRDHARGMIDSVLGWRYRPGYRSERYEMNAQGLRSSREYSPVPAPGILRVAAFGDSFVYGTEVANSQAWPAVMEQLYSTLEVLNYGIGGYGTDQALLRFRLEGNDLSPQIVLIGFAPVNLRRTVNVYRRFISSREQLLTKPRFVLDSTGELQLIDSPIQSADDWAPILDQPSLITQWGRNDHWYRPLRYENPARDWSATVRLTTAIWIRLDNRYFNNNRLFVGDIFNTASTAFKIQISLLQMFVDEVIAVGARPIVLILPSRQSLEAKMQGRGVEFQPLADRLGELEIPFVDATGAFILADDTSVGDWFSPDNHYSELGNRVLADWLATYLLQSTN